MPRNDYDQAARFAARLDPPGFLGWALGLGPAGLAFGGWLDTRAVPFPGGDERTGDTVARVDDPTGTSNPWAVAVEFQTDPDPLMFGRLLGYLSGLWLALKPDPGRGSRFAVGAVVVNLTGRGTASRDFRWPATGLVTQLGVVERNLEREPAADLLAALEAGARPRALLPWVPLMTGGGEPGIIDRWKQIAGTDPDDRRRSEYGGLALVFADAAGRKVVWEQALKEWNVKRSAVVDGWMAEGEAKGRAEGRTEGRAEGRTEGRVVEAQALLRRMGIKKFGHPPAPEQHAVLDAIADPDQLEALAERLLDVASWGELLAPT